MGGTPKTTLAPQVNFKGLNVPWALLIAVGFLPASRPKINKFSVHVSCHFSIKMIVLVYRITNGCLDSNEHVTSSVVNSANGINWFEP